MIHITSTDYQNIASRVAQEYGNFNFSYLLTSAEAQLDIQGYINYDTYNDCGTEIPYNLSYYTDITAYDGNGTQQPTDYNETELQNQLNEILLIT